MNHFATTYEPIMHHHAPEMNHFKTQTLASRGFSINRSLKMTVQALTNVDIFVPLYSLKPAVDGLKTYSQLLITFPA